MNEKLIEKMIIKKFSTISMQSNIKRRSGNASETYSNGDSFKY